MELIIRLFQAGEWYDTDSLNDLGISVAEKDWRGSSCLSSIAASAAGFKEKIIRRFAL